MRITTGTSDHSHAEIAIQEAFTRIHDQHGALPQMMVVYASAGYKMEVLIEGLQTLAPGVPVHPGVSYHGVMSEKGLCGGDTGRGLGIFAIYDEGGAYGTGRVEIRESAHDAAVEAARFALKMAKRPGEVPAFLWLTIPAGVDEDVIAGLVNFFGPNVPILGGSAADEDSSGRWTLFKYQTSPPHSVVVSVFFPTSQISFAFQGGCDPTEYIGTVTRGSGRLIEELDGKPALDVYNAWTGGKLNDDSGKDANVMEKTSLFPLGRLVGQFGGVPYFQLSHPVAITAEKGITVFTQVQKGDRFYLMTASEDALVRQSKWIVEAALRNAPSGNPKIAGALLAYCAGAMLAVKNRMPEVISCLRGALGSETPFLGAFTFGEEGTFFGGENRHGNLMLSVVLLLQ